MSRSLAWLAAIIVTLLFLVAFIAPSLARDPDGRYAQSPLKEWFDGLRSKGGADGHSGSLCCSDADGTAVKDVDWDTKDGHYRVRLHGEWIDVPPEAVVEVPNRFGPAVVWPVMSEGATYIRCFLPGAGA